MKTLLYIFVILICFYSQPNLQTKPFYFAWISDTHVGGSTGAQDLEFSVDDINKQDSISFIVISGDITEFGSSAELNEAKTILNNLKKPLYIIPGNHDTKWSESGGTYFGKLWGNDRFVFEYEGICFIGLHQGPRMRMGDGHWAPEDLRWLDSVLNRIDKNQEIIFITHYPVDGSITNWYEVINRLKNKNIGRILCGHGHRNKQFNFGNIPGVMGRSNLRAKEKSGGYNIVNIREDSTFFFEKKPGFEKVTKWFSDKSFYQLKSVPDFVGDKNGKTELNAEKISVQWKYNSGYTIATPPKIYQNKVFVGNSEGKMLSIDLKTGILLWSFNTGSPIFSEIEIIDDYGVFSSTDGFIYCVSIDNGKEKWKVKCNSPNVASPMINDGIVYVSGSDKTFRALKLTNGELIWQFNDFKGFSESKPVFSDDKIIFTAWDEHVYCIDKTKGKLIWKWKNIQPGRMLSPAACIPVISENRLFLVSPDRSLSCIDITNGSTLNRTGIYQVRETIGKSIDGKKVFIRTLYDTILAINSTNEDFNPIWITNCGFGYDINSAQIVEKDGNIFYSTKTGLILSLDSENGKIIFKYDSGNALVNTPSPINRNELVYTNFDGEIVFIKYK